MSQEDDTIARLLRLKRYEQPPPHYFEEFLHEFQQRQRAEMLRRPLWRIGLDRIEAYWNQLSLSQLSYAGASAAVLLGAAVFTADMLQHPGGANPAASFAYQSYPVDPSLSAPLHHERVTPPGRSINTPRYAATHSESLPVRQVSGAPFTLNPQIEVAPDFFRQPVRTGATHSHPRYILDPRPVSYDAPISF